MTHLEGLDGLYQLLPPIYRDRDAEQNYPLRDLLRVIDEQVLAVEGDVAQLYDNWFIETCADWVVPYIGDLIGYQPVREAGEASTAGALGRVLTPRREVVSPFQHAAKLLLIADVVIRCQNGDKRLTLPPFDLEAAEGDRRSIVPPRRLGQDVCAGQLRQLLAAFVLVLIIGGDIDRIDGNDTCDTGEGLLQERLAVEDAEELLGILVGAERAEASSRSAGENQRGAFQRAALAAAMTSSVFLAAPFVFRPTAIRLSPDDG